MNLINYLCSTECTYLKESEGAIEHFLFAIVYFGLLKGRSEDKGVQSYMGLTLERT